MIDPSGHEVSFESYFDPPDEEENISHEWKDICIPIHISQHEILASVERDLSGSIEFTLDLGRLTCTWIPKGGVEYRFLREHDYIHVQRPAKHLTFRRMHDGSIERNNGNE